MESKYAKRGTKRAYYEGVSDAAALAAAASAEKKSKPVKFGPVLPPAMVARRSAAYRASLNQRTGGALGVELKYIDGSWNTAPTASATAQTANPATGSLCCPTQGSGASQRDGNRIVIKNIDVFGSAFTATASASGAVPTDGLQFWVAIVQDKQTNAAALTATDVYGGTLPLYPFRNLLNTQRFRVLAFFHGVQHCDCLGQDAAGTFRQAYRQVPFRLTKKVNIPVTFKAAAGAIGDIVDNSIQVLICVENHSVQSIQYNSRVRFLG